MPSQLTRHVFRRLLADEPIFHPGCLRRRQQYSSLVHTRGTHAVLRRYNGIEPPQNYVLFQKRTFLGGIFGAPKQNRKEAHLDPGIDVMMDLVKRQRMSARLPSRVQVREAIGNWVNATFQQRGVLEDTQAELLLPSVKYILEDESLYARKGVTYWLYIRKLAIILSRQPKHTCDTHVELAKIMLQQDLNGRPQLRVLVALFNVLCSAGKPEQALKVLRQYCGTGHTTTSQSEQEARDLDAQQYDPLHSEDMTEIEGRPKSQEAHDPIVRYTHKRLWTIMARTFAQEGMKTKFLNTIAMAPAGMLDHLVTRELMLELYMVQNARTQMESAWKEYWNLAKHSQDVTRQLICDLLEWCGKDHQSLDLGHQIVRDVLTTVPSKRVWDSIFAWAASTGKGVDEIDRMMGVMEASAQDGEGSPTSLKTDTDTINKLVETAISKGDPYMAERFISLGKDRGIQSDARTFDLQMIYRLSVNDVNGALMAYKNLQACGSAGDDDVVSVNKLIVALCDSKDHDFETIMNVAADLSDRRAHFEPLTVSKLTLLHLSRDEIPDVIDLLNTHASHYSLAGRASIRETLISCATDPQMPPARAWDSYMICREVFDELPRDQRTRIMSAFFERNRADIAVNIFNHMRAHTRADTIPNIATYITAFSDIAKLRDFNSLELIHNQLKLDFNINLNTHIRNVLIAAHTTCGQPRQGLSFWDDIVASREGPSYNSIHLALRACECSPFGDLKAQEIWAQLRSRNVQLDNALWASYIAALVGNGNVKHAVSTLEEAESQGELDVDAFVLGSLFMSAPGHDYQAEVELWGKERYPQVWVELEKTGVREFKNGKRVFGIDRRIELLEETP